MVYRMHVSTFSPAIRTYLKTHHEVPHVSFQRETRSRAGDPPPCGKDFPPYLTVGLDYWLSLNQINLKTEANSTKPERDNE